MDNTIDSLQIDIVDSATNADKSLDALVSSLKKLDRIGKSNSFSIIQKQLKGIAGVKFDRLESQLTSITKNLKELKGYQNFLKNINLGTPTIDTVAVSESVDAAVEEIGRAREEILTVGESFGDAANVRPAWLDDVQTECDSIVESFGVSAENINSAKKELLTMLSEKKSDFGDQSAFIGATNFTDTLDDKMTKLSLKATMLQEKMAAMVESGNVDTTAWYNLQTQLLGVKLQYSQLDQAARKHTRSVDALGKSVEKTKKPLGKLIAQFGRVAMYRAIRMVLSQIMSALTEGLQNAAKFSEEANQIMSGYKTEFLYIKNSLGSALLPIMQALLPTVVRLGDAFADIMNSVGLIGAWINGEDTFLKATKYAQNYKKSLDDVRRATVGFDEINVLSKPDTNSDYTKMFEEVDISGWDVAGSIAKITALVASITALVLMIKGVKLGDVFMKMGKGIKTAWTYLKNASGWKKAGISIAALATEAVVCYTSFYDAAKGTQSWGNALLSVIPTMALVGAAMYAMLGPVGLVAAAFVGVTSAIAGTLKANAEIRKEVNNKKFFEGTSDMAVSLDELSTAFSNVWATTETMASETENATGIINELAKEIQASYDVVSNYLNKLDDTGSLTEAEAEEIRQNITSMVDNLEQQMNTRMESIFNTFKDLAELCKTDFCNELGEMEVEFLKFQEMLGNATNDYQGTVDDLLDKVVQGTITEEEKAELQNALDSLAALNITYSNEQYVYDSLLEQALSNGVDLGNADNVNSFLTELGTATTGYLASLKTNYQGTDKRLLEYKAMNQALFDQGKISEADFNSYNASFDKARTDLKTMYDTAVQRVYDEVYAIIDLIQSNVISGMSGYASDLENEFNNASWWDKHINIFSKFWDENAPSYVYGGLNDIYRDSVSSIDSSINDFYSTIGSDKSASLSDDFYDIKERLVEYHMGSGYYSWDEDIDSLIAEKLSNYKSTIPDTNVGSNTVGSSSYRDPLLNQWSTGPHPDYPNPSQWMLDYGVQLTKNEATVLRRELSRRNGSGSYDAKIADLKAYIEWMNAQGYATGGFPEDDSLIYVNPHELIGKMSNGKNVVANNYQIIEGIKQGVSEAMSESGGNGGDWTIQIVDTNGNVKGETIITAAERKNRRDGKTVIAVGG